MKIELNGRRCLDNWLDDGECYEYENGTFQIEVDPNKKVVTTHIVYDSELGRDFYDRGCEIDLKEFVSALLPLSCAV